MKHLKLKTCHSGLSRILANKRLHFGKKLLAFFLISSLLILNTIYYLPTTIYAAASPWTQTDWSGGSGQTAWSDNSKFSSSSTITTSTAGQTTLTNTEELSNTDFETDLTSWDTPDYTTTLEATQADNLMAHYPLNETSGSVAGVTNAATATGRDIVINGDFATDTNWSKQTGWTISGGTASSDGSQVASSFLFQQNMNGAFSQPHEVTFTISNYSAGSIQPRLGGINLGTARSANGTYTETITWSTIGTSFNLIADADFIGDIDNVSVKQKNIAASTAFPGSEELTDGDMEAAGVGDWTAEANATLTKETTDPYAGTQNLKVAYNGTSSPRAVQDVLTVGKRYKATGQARGDGSFTPLLVSGGVVEWTGTTSTSWQSFSVEFTQTTNGIVKLQSNATGAGYAEFDDVSVTEVNPLNGDITGATVGQTGIGDGNTAYSFDGSNDYVDIYSAELNSTFNPDAGTLLAWAKVSGAGVWTDGTIRVFANLSGDDNNFIQMAKWSVDNQMIIRYLAGGTTEQININGVSSTDYIMAVITWDTSADEMKVYFNGAQSGSTQTSLGTWVGNLSSTGSIIGGTTTTPSFPWDGSIAHTALWNTALTPTEIAALYSNVVTSSRDTGTTYGSSSGAAKIVAATDSKFTQSVNVGDTNTYNLSAYAYTDGTAVSASDLELWYNGATITTTYTDQGSGWYKLTGTLTGANASREYGVQVKAGKTAYVDDFSLNSYASSGTVVSSIFDTEQSSNFGILTFTATTPTNTTATVKARSSNNSDMSGATAFSSCSSISSGSDLSSTGGCVTDMERYIQYEITQTTSDNSITSTFSDISIAFTQGQVTLSLDSPAGNSYTNSERPNFKWKAGDEANSGLSDYTVEVDNGPSSSGQGGSGDFMIQSIPVNRTEDYETNKYIAHYTGFSDGVDNNNYISVQTRSTNDWGETNNDGKLKEGKRTWTVKAKDNTGVEYTDARDLFVDYTGPDLSSMKINNSQFPISNIQTPDTTPTITGRITDRLSGDSSSDSEQERIDNMVSSGPKEAEIKIEKKNLAGLYTLYSISTININKIYWESDNTEIKDNSRQYPPSLNSSNGQGKYADFSYTPTNSLPQGEYIVTVKGTDNANNTKETSFNLTIGAYQTIVTPEEIEIVEKTVEEEYPDTTEEEKEELTQEIIKETVKTAEVKGQSIIQKAVTTIAQVLFNTYWGVVNVAKAIGNTGIAFVSGTRSIVINLTEGTGKGYLQFVYDTNTNTFAFLAGKIPVKLIAIAEMLFDDSPTVIRDVQISKIGKNSATITWTTNHYTKNNKVNYGEDLSYGKDEISLERERFHTITITGLKPGTKYFFEVMSQNSNYVYDAHHEFTTPTSP